MTNTNEIPELLTPREAAVLLRCHYKTVFVLIHEGKLRASKLGKQRYRIQRSAITECLERTEEVAEKVVTEVVTGQAEKRAAGHSGPSPLLPSFGNKNVERYRNSNWRKDLRRS